MIECSSDGSDIIEINDDVESENSYSNSSFKPLLEKSPSKVMRVNNGDPVNGGHTNGHSCEISKEIELKMNGHVKNSGNQEQISNGKADDSITLID